MTTDARYTQKVQKPPLKTPKNDQTRPQTTKKTPKKAQKRQKTRTRPKVGFQIYIFEHFSTMCQGTLKRVSESAD